MALYDPVNGVYRKVSKKYDPVDGVYRNVTKAYDPVDGVYREYFGSSSIPAGELAVGDSVWMNVNGIQTEFLVVHQGNPSSYYYDASCDGTWLLMKDIYVKKALSDYDIFDYQSSIVHAYLNGTFFGLLDGGVQSAIKQVKIPHTYAEWDIDYETRDEYVSGVVDAIGSNGLSTKVFILSACEVGWRIHDPYIHQDGISLAYFSGSSFKDSRRIAYYNGVADYWHLRSMAGDSATAAYGVMKKGDISLLGGTSGVRPAFILDSNTPIAQSDGKNIIE